MESSASQSSPAMLQKAIRFSESFLWQQQRDYYDKLGIDAWINLLPFYITSNPFIAQSYASVVVGFIRDWLEKHPEAKKHTFYILEAGTGSGRFSFYTLKAIHQQLHDLNLQDVSICYIMSDCTPNIIKYYENHPALLSYIEEGQIDFAVYNIDVDAPIHLLHKNIDLTPDVLLNPLILFANYMLDSITHDLFCVENGKISEVLLDLSTDKNNLENSKPKDMEKIIIQYRNHAINTKNYYNVAEFDHIINSYKNIFVDTVVSFPIGALRAFNHLRKLSNNKLLVVATDKGYNSLSSLENLDYPKIIFHANGGCFSMMVNFHAIAQYFKNIDGDYFLQSRRPGIKTSVYCAGFKLKEMSHLSHAIHRQVDEVSPLDYFNLHRDFSNTIDRYDLETLLSQLIFSRYDPYLYSLIHERILSLLSDLDIETDELLVKCVKNAADNYYHIPKSSCAVFEAAVLFHTMKNYAQALYYYDQAKVYLSDQASVFYNMGLCLYHLGRNVEALIEFKRSLELDPGSQTIIEWIDYLQQPV